MFAAAMLFSTPGLELSIYSTCKRISQKLMRNVTKFVDLIYAAIPGTPPLPVIRSNMEEVVLQGPDGRQDVRIVNSYPSKVLLHTSFSLHTLVYTLVLFQSKSSVQGAQSLALKLTRGVPRLLKLLHRKGLCSDLQGLQRGRLPAQV